MKDPEVIINRGTSPYEKMYLKERKKSTIFLITTVIFALLFAGSMIVHFGGTTTGNTNGAPSFGSSNSSTGGGMGMGGGQQDQSQSGKSETKVTSYLNSDGSVNTTKVASALTSAETRAKEMIKKQIEQATSNGDITSSQETALEKAFGF